MIQTRKVQDTRLESTLHILNFGAPIIRVVKLTGRQILPRDAVLVQSMLWACIPIKDDTVA